MRRVLVGIAGGTGSGKTTVARKIMAHLPRDSAVIMDLDSYYLDNSDVPPDERKQFNFDHPDAFDWPLVNRHVDALLAGHAVDKPLYNFVESVRMVEVTPLPSAPIIILEGIMALHDAALRDRMTAKVFVDNDADVRLGRRLVRDIHERGRSVDQVLDQYFRTVRPMHLQYVWPSRRHADVVIPNEGLNDVAVAMVAAGLRAAVEGRAEPGMGSLPPVEG
ncbi:MAG: uridine kinase [Deltaproteobacteria bacterium]|nr:uridine kinase [Deltaproteobacteria bacterium]